MIGLAPAPAPTRAGVGTAAAGLLLRQLDLLTVDEAGLWRAGRLPSPAGTFLRTADAIHLVAAMELGESEFLTYDRRQAQAAAERGFVVIAPGRPDGWHVQRPADPPISLTVTSVSTDVPCEWPS